MFTHNSLPTDGSAGPFPIGFNYLNPATVVVTRYDADGVSNPVNVPFTFIGTATDDQPSGNSVVLVSAIPAGYVLSIDKVIDLSKPALVWNQGAEITQKNLRKTTRNLMEMAQAAFDKAVAAITRNQTVVDNIYTIIPANVLATASAISADRAAVSTARDTAVAAANAASASKAGVSIALDFGTDTDLTEKVFVITSVPCTVGQEVTVHLSGKPSVDHTADEVAFEDFSCKAYVSATNTITITATSLHGSVYGVYNFKLYI